MFSAVDVTAADPFVNVDPLTSSEFAILRQDGDRDEQFADLRNHPILPALRYAYARYEYMERDVQDYVCNVYIRERVRGRLRSLETAAAKIRHRQSSNSGTSKPFSVYLKYLGPKSIKGREILFVENNYDDRMVMTLGGRGGLGGVTLALNPHGERAMSETRYPITSFGMLDTTRQLLVRGMKEMKNDRYPDEWDVRFIEQAKMGDRKCLCIQVVRTRRREEYSFHRLRIFIDDELQVPVRFTSSSFSKEPGGLPRLDEEYSYTDVRLNTGLTDREFDVSHPDYGFDEQRVGPRKNSTARLR